MVRQLEPQAREVRAETVASHQSYRELRPTDGSALQPPGSSPDNFLLSFLRDGRLRVVSPIHVTVAHENEHIICEAPELNEFGFGATLSDAVTDLQQAIAQLYFSLEADQARLGTDLQEVWSVLQRKIARR